MATTVAELVAKLSADTSGFDKAMGKADGKSRKVASVMSKGFLAIGAAAVVGGAFAVKAASNLEEQINKTRVVFRGSEEQILSWSKTTASGLGISQRAALEAAGTFGNMLVPMGLARGKAAQMSRSMVNLAADMASFNNASPEETLDALRSGLAGETEPLRKFGVFLNEARVKQEAVRLGLYKGKGALEASAKAQATYSIILKDTTDAQGDFARTSDSVANSQRILRAEVEDLAAQMGNALLPAMRGALTVGLSLVDTISNNESEFQGLAIATGLVGAAVVAANAALNIYNAELVIATGMTKGLRVAMASVPILALGVGILALIDYLGRQEQATGEAEDQQRNLTDALSDYHRAIRDGNDARKEYESSSRRVEAAEISLKRAVQQKRQVMKDDNSTLLDRREAALRVADAQGSLRDAEAAATVSGTKLRNNQLRQTGASNDARVSIERLAKGYKDWRTGLGRLDTPLERTKAGIDKHAFSMNIGRRNAERYADAVRAAAARIADQQPKFARTARLAATLADAWGRVVSLPAAREFIARFRVITSIEESRLNTPNHPRRARGGNVTMGQAYTVGERGPETFVPHTPGRIVPNGGGSGTVIVNLPAGSYIYDPEGLLRLIERASKTSGRRGGPRLNFGT